MTTTRSSESHIAALAGKLLRLRWLVRAPIWLFRARLGFLAGSRLLLLEHIGRNSGARRYVVLEVVDRPTGNSYVVASGFGERSQWFRNIRANPSVRVIVGGNPSRAGTAHVLTPVEARTALQRYSRRHPRAWRTLRPVFESTLRSQIDDDGTNLPLVRIELDNRR
jgi:deazaflavin-dependent oxidoreductase (nitroreductase family)